MDKVRYHEMLPHEIVARRAKCPAAFIGLGGLEWHGEHLAVGNDALKAERLCELAAAASGGFALPTLWYGEPRSTRLLEANHNQDGRVSDKMRLPARNFTTAHFGKRERDQIKFYQQLVHHVLVQMNTLGFKAVCFLSGHYPLKGMVDPVIARFHGLRRYRRTRAFCGIEFNYPRPENRRKAGGDHAAHWETSYLWYLRPDCVDMSVYLGRADEPLVGVFGEDPRQKASVELGRKASALIVRGMVRKARELIAQAGE